MTRQRPGFTIVELLIVIVVIGILAAITIVAYNGFQERAKNTQTNQAVASWIKGLQLYKAENNSWPNAWTCLGDGYKYGSTGSDTTGTAQCRQSGSSVVVESSMFKTTMRAYMGNNLPNPAFVSAASTSTLWYRGITYVFGGGVSGLDVYMQVVYAGSVPCPSVSGIASTQSAAYGGNTVCYFQIGYTTDT